MIRKHTGILALITFVVIGLAVGGFMAVREQGGLEFALFRLKHWYVEKIGGGFPKPSSSELKAAQREADAVTARIIKLHPELSVKMNGVPPERNGFLALLSLRDDARVNALVASKLPERCNAAPMDFDAAAIALDLEKYSEIGKEIERAASMPERSSADLPERYNGFLPAREVKCIAEYLILKSRLAAEAGDADEAFRMMALAVNLQDHCAKVELPNFLSETVVILVGMSMRDVVMENILPKLGKDEDLQRWQKLFAPSANPSARYAELIVGEWYFFGKWGAKWVFLCNSEEAVPDPEAVCQNYASWNAANVRTLLTYSVGDLLDKGTLPIKTTSTTISTEGIGLLRDLVSGSGAWRKGFVRAHVYFAQFDSAMDLMMREQGGEDLSALSKTYVLNPVTGDPFVFDPAVRNVLGAEVSDVGKTSDIKFPW